MDDSHKVFRTRLAGGYVLWPPTFWAKIHAAITLAFFVATFGAMLGAWAGSIKEVMGWPETIFWIMLWMVIMTLNLVWMYYTSCKGWAEKLDAVEIRQVEDPWVEIGRHKDGGGIANA